MEVVDPRSFLSAGLFREKDFRGALQIFNWSQFEGKPVLIQGCGSIPIPVWAYLMIMAQLVPVAKSISFGELKDPIPVLGSLGAGSTARNERNQEAK